MCLVVTAHAVVQRYRLVLAANRDELHARPAQAAGWWTEAPDVFGGRDLLAGGTWLAASRDGRVAAVTNVRDGTPRQAPRSRGVLVTGYLDTRERADAFAAEVTAAGTQFAAFNLLVFDGRDLRYASNRAPAARLAPGIHALSNAPLGVEWPKTRSAESGIAALLAAESDPLEGLFALLAERANAGAGEEAYRSAHFITGPVYGTRCSTVVLIDESGVLTFAERSFDAQGAFTGQVRERFEIEARAAP
jgi:uncharacterized protein with NRDE domain